MPDSTFSALAAQLAQVHTAAQHAALHQVNYWLTARNWLVGYYLVEYEQVGVLLVNGHNPTLSFAERECPTLAPGIDWQPHRPQAADLVRKECGRMDTYAPEVVLWNSAVGVALTLRHHAPALDNIGLRYGSSTK